MDLGMLREDVWGFLCFLPLLALGVFFFGGVLHIFRFFLAACCSLAHREVGGCGERTAGHWWEGDSGWPPSQAKRCEASVRGKGRRFAPIALGGTRGEVMCGSSTDGPLGVLSGTHGVGGGLRIFMR